MLSNGPHTIQSRLDEATDPHFAQCRDGKEPDKLLYTFRLTVPPVRLTSRTFGLLPLPDRNQTYPNSQPLRLSRLIRALALSLLVNRPVRKS